MLLELTQLPAASGKEQRVTAWITRWAATHPSLALTTDPSGNITIAFRNAPQSARPIYFTAHTDHPAFVLERFISPSVVELSFRGGVMDDYFKSARVRIFSASDRTVEATLQEDVPTESRGSGGPFKHYLATLDSASDAPKDLAIGDVAIWALPPAEIIDGIVHTYACDDLAALAAAAASMDVLARAWGDAPQADVRLLFTRAEEIGFIGALAACRHRTIPQNARIIALENSRSFAESPIGGGPIVRVGDRISVFSPSLTGAIARRAEEIAGGASTVTAAQKHSEAPAWKWQRKLMDGGACEASVFCFNGFESTCVCLPLGNYHNMADLAAVQAGTNTQRPRVGREYIAIADFDNLVDLLVACGVRLPDMPALGERFDKLWNDRAFVLG